MRLILVTFGSIFLNDICVFVEREKAEPISP